MVIQQGGEGVDRLLPAAVAEGERDVRSGGAAAADLGRVLERSGRAVRQYVEVASDVNLPGGVVAELVLDDLLDHLHQERDLGVCAVGEVLGRADEHGDVPDPGLLAPVQHVLDVVGPVLVAQARIGHALPAGPPPGAPMTLPPGPGIRPPPRGPRSPRAYGRSTG